MIYSLVNTDDFDVELYKNLDLLTAAIEGRMDKYEERWVSEVYMGNYVPFSITAVKKLLKQSEAIDIYEDGLLCLVVKKHG